MSPAESAAGRKTGVSPAGVPVRWGTTLVIAGLGPLFWAWPLAWLGIVGIVASLVIRRAILGRVATVTQFTAAFIGLAWLFPLWMVPALDLAAVLPRALTVVWGCLVVVVLGDLGSVDAVPRRLLWGATLVLVCGLTGFVLVATDWTGEKLVALQAIYSRIPQLVTGVTDAGTRGGIHPNQAAGVLAVVLPLALVGSLEGCRPMVRRRVGWALTLACGGAWLAGSAVLALTQSRSGYIAFLVSTLTVLILIIVPSRGRVPAWSRWLGGSAAALVALVTVATATYLVLEWVRGGSVAAAYSLPGRLALWERAWQMVQDFWLTGVGMGQFPHVLRSFYPTLALPESELLPHPHNQALTLLVDLGVPGAALFAFGAAGLAAGLVRLATLEGAAQRVWAAGLFAALVAFAVYGLTDALAPGSRGGLGVWIVLGLAAALVQPLAVAPREDRRG